jgi:anti-anti-sigma regulatory factor
MLRITIQDGENTKVVLLEGKIIGAWTEEFDRTWHALEQSLDSRKLQLDLRGVSFVDDRGKQVLREIYRKTNASFIANSPLTRYYADEAMQQVARTIQEGD